MHHVVAGHLLGLEHVNLALLPKRSFQLAAIGVKAVSPLFILIGHQQKTALSAP